MIIPSSLLIDNGSKFTSKFFAALCTFLGTDITTMTAYYPKANGQMERLNKTITARFRFSPYVNEHPSDWGKLVHPLINA